MKKYIHNGELFIFSVLEEHDLHGEHEGEKCFYGKCWNNSKFAWLDNSGFQFEGEEKHYDADLVAETHKKEKYDNSVVIWGNLPRPKYNYQKPSY